MTTGTMLWQMTTGRCAGSLLSVESLGASKLEGIPSLKSLRRELVVKPLQCSCSLWRLPWRVPANRRACAWMHPLKPGIAA